jgi:signal peptidase I
MSSGLQRLTWLALFLLAALPVGVGAWSGGAMGLAYVTSNSMEPTLRLGDGFLVWPVRAVPVGEIIVFRPVVLQADRVVHRIVGRSADGYVTRGDNSAGTDQAAGEPPVTPDRIIGRVVSAGGNPIRIPHLGGLSSLARSLLRERLSLLAGSTLALSLLLFLWDYLRPGRHRPLRTRWRVRHLYTAGAGVAMLVILTALLMGSGVRSVEYLVSQNPSPDLNHVKQGEGGLVRLPVSNPGMVPVWHFSRALPPGQVVRAPERLAPGADESLTIRLGPQERLGWHRAYVQVYHYPPLLPRRAVAALHQLNPYVAIASGLLVLLVLFGALSTLLDLGVPLAGQRESVLAWRVGRLWRRLAARRWRP